MHVRFGRFGLMLVHQRMHMYMRAMRAGAMGLGRQLFFLGGSGACVKVRWRGLGERRETNPQTGKPRVDEGSNAFIEDI